MIAFVTSTALVASGYFVSTTGLHNLLPLYSSSTHASLAFDNTGLSGARFWVLLVSLIASTIVSSLTALVIGPKKRSATPTNRVDDLSLSMPFKIRQADVETYVRAVNGFAPPATPSSTTPASINDEDVWSNPMHLNLLLSALTEPAMLLLLCKRGCPVNPIGTVNVRNRFELLSTNLDARLRAEIVAEGVRALRQPQPGVQIPPSKWTLASRLDSKVPVKRGWEYTVIVDLLDGAETVYRQTVTFLQFEKHSSAVSATITVRPTNTDTADAGTEVGVVSMAGSEPATWAELSKDHNPIHFSSLAAKAFGLRGKVAHGNHVVAKSLRHIAASSAFASTLSTRAMTLEFRRPVFVPAKLEVRSGTEKATGGEPGFGVWLKDKCAIQVGLPSSS